MYVELRDVRQPTLTYKMCKHKHCYRPEYLSADELRNRLYHSLRNRGFVDSIKSQLRNSLVTELQQTVHGPLTIKDLKVPDEGSLLHRASNSLVANHLSACHYEYTLSVFLPESGLSQDMKFEATDLLKLLNISPHSRLYQRLNVQSQKDSKKGFLWQLLSEVSSLHANSLNTVGCQTDLIKVGPITPLDEKLSDVDEMFASRREDYLHTGRAGAEERLLSFQRQLEDHYNTQLKMELARMRESEIAAIKLEEKENNRKALEHARKEMERVYKDRYDALVIRERNTMERLQQQTEIQEREIYAQRQSILEEIEAVRQREAEVKREAEVNKREKRISEERVKDKETELRRRELEIKQRESSFEQRLQNEMAQFKLDQQARFIERIQNVEVREATLKEQERIVAEEKSKLQQVKDELWDKTQRVNELETKLSECKYSEVNANKNNEYLNAKLRDMSDYKTLKEQVILYRNELETLRTRLAEVLSMNERERGRQEELLRELRRPSPETLMLQRDLERAKESLRQEQIVFNQQKQMLEARLKEELDRNKDLLERFQEQTLQMKEMNREVVDLRQHLHMTTKALNNEVYRKPKENPDQPQLNESLMSQRAHGESHHLVEFNFNKVEPQRPSRFDPDPKEIYHGVDFESFSQIRDGVCFEDDASSTDSADIIAQAKYRLKSLDQEAHNLERAYHDFHCRITNAHALPADKPPQSSAVIRVAGPHQDVNSITPIHSPIPFDNPRSSTPYKQRKKPQEFNETRINHRRPRIMISYKGRLGNHMFEYATLMGLAKHYNMTAIIPEDLDVLNVFKLPTPQGPFSLLRDPYNTYTEEKAAAYYKGVENIDSTRDAFLVGYFQSWKYYKDIRNELLDHHFVLHDNLRTAADQYIQKVLAGENLSGATLVAIHVRRGDFVRQRVKGYTAAPIPYYYKAMNYFRKKYGKVLFIICTNDLIWAETNLDDSPDVHYYHETDGSLDLAIMISCNHMIITSGSYSWWAGYLVRGEAIYYAGYPQPNTKIGNLTVKEDYYPPNWLGML
ncbi:hypothetical protein Btru_031696 [Bulinus truncatus]|nr:hypothetical protein Btru_031696 [Bulinus truncatus]